MINFNLTPMGKNKWMDWNHYINRLDQSIQALASFINYSYPAYDILNLKRSYKREKVSWDVLVDYGLIEAETKEGIISYNIPIYLFNRHQGIYVEKENTTYSLKPNGPKYFVPLNNIVISDNKTIRKKPYTSEQWSTNTNLNFFDPSTFYVFNISQPALYLPKMTSFIFHNFNPSQKNGIIISLTNQNSHFILKKEIINESEIMNFSSWDLRDYEKDNIYWNNLKTVFIERLHISENKIIEPFYSDESFSITEEKRVETIKNEKVEILEDVIVVKNIGLPHQSEDKPITITWSFL